MRLADRKFGFEKRKSQLKILDRGSLGQSLGKINLNNFYVDLSLPQKKGRELGGGDGDGFVGCRSHWLIKLVLEKPHGIPKKIF